MRRPKLDFANWHVTARGARRLLLFHDDADYKMFYALLGQCCSDAGMDLVADCLMSNHFHLSLAGATSQLTRCMQRLNRAYAGYHNERYGLSGHAFDQAYYGEPIPSDFILQRVVRYIHMNPVRGGKAARPELYEWSSYRRLVDGSSKILAQGELRFLTQFDPDPRKAQRMYRLFTEKDLQRRMIPPVGRTTAWDLWQEQFSWLIDCVRENEMFLDPLEPEVVAIHFGSRIGIPPRAMGSFLHHSDGRQISTILRNFGRQLERNPSLKAKLDTLRIL